VLDPSGTMPMPMASTAITDAVSAAPTAPAGLRMAHGTPRIAALLQAHIAGSNQRDAFPSPHPIGLEPKADDHRPAHNAGAAAVAVDMDALVERLSQQLEFELMRIYGTSEG